MKWDVNDTTTELQPGEDLAICFSATENGDPFIITWPHYAFILTIKVGTTEHTFSTDDGTLHRRQNIVRVNLS